MFKPCPNCGFLVALIAGREASQRCPRCGSAMLEDGELPPVEDAPPARRAGEREAAASRHVAPASPEDPEPRAAAASHPGAGDSMQGAPPDARAERMDSSPSPRAADAAADAGPAAPEADPAREADTTVEAPSFAARRAARRAARGRRWPWAIALPALALLLALQLLLSQRVELARDARWRPLLVTACDVLRCEVPAWREPDAFEMLARNVQPDPKRPGVLHVTTSLKNGAEWPQPLPVVVLSLSDVDGRVLAARAVAPAEYGRPQRVLVAPGESVDIAFDVREPSPRVVSFDFRLR